MVTGVQTCALPIRSEEHTSELQSHSEISYAVFCLKKKNHTDQVHHIQQMLDIDDAHAGVRRQRRRRRRYRDRPARSSDAHPSFFFFNDTATTEIYTLSYTLSLHDALPISPFPQLFLDPGTLTRVARPEGRSEEHTSELQSHSEISYAVFCLKKKKQNSKPTCTWPGTGTRRFPMPGAARRSSAKQSALVNGTSRVFYFFFFNDTATTEIYTLSYTLSLHDALPIYSSHIQKSRMPSSACDWSRSEEHTSELQSHSEISYAVS